MEELVSALKAVAEPTRLRLLALCAHMDLTVSQLVQILGQSQPRVSRHLKLLSDAGLLDRHREGSWVVYRLRERGGVAELARTLVDSIPAQDPTFCLDMERLDRIRQERAALAADYFRRNAAHWDEIRALHVEDAQVEQRLLDIIVAADVNDLLDIGTGTGRVIEILGANVPRVVGVDLSTEMLTVARANLEKAGLRNCLLRQGDMYQLPMPPQSFDAVTMHQVLHYADQPARVIAEAGRVLKPQGQLIVVDFGRHDLDYLRQEQAHLWLGFRDDDITGWFEDAGLEPQPTTFLPGDSLTVGIWQARRAA